MGALIASALPVGQTENQPFGESSDHLKDRASTIASEGVEVATTAARDVYQESVSRIQEEGLSPEVARETVKGVGEKVNKIVGRVTNALEEKTEKAGSTSPSTTQHK